MKIKVKQSGGYAGTEDEAEIDTQELPAPDASRLGEMVEEANFFDIAEETDESAGADMIRYEITVSNPRGQHTVSFHDDGSPDKAPLKRLADSVRGLQRT